MQDDAPVAARPPAPDLSRLGLLIPTLNAAVDPLGTLSDLSTLAADLGDVLVVDGGSTDQTARIVASSGARLVVSQPGRGRQLAHGLSSMTTPWVMIMHADSRPVSGWQQVVAQFMADPANHLRAGYFQLQFASPRDQARRVERWSDWRCRRFGLPYGDQGLVLSRDLLRLVGGIQPVPLMEDVDLVQRIGRQRLVRLPARMMTSPARYERDGWWLRPIRNLCCLALYRMGVAPERLVTFYKGRGGRRT